MIRTKSGQQVRLRQRDDPCLHAEEPKHVEVLCRLWHRSLVGGDAQHGHVDAERRSHHRAEEALVAGHVHDARGAYPGQLEVRVSRLESDPAPLLFRKPVGIDSGERLHQRRLPVIDVARRSDDDTQRTAHSSTQAIPGANRARSRCSWPCITATGTLQYNVEKRAAGR